MPRVYRNPEGDEEGGGNPPPSPVELGGRIAQVVGLYPSQSQAAESAGVSLSQLKRYMAGGNTPSLIAGALLADGVDASLEWLVFGRGDLMKKAYSSDTDAQLDYNLMRDVISAVEDDLNERREQLAADVKARLISTLYRMRIAERRKPSSA